VAILQHSVGRGGSNLRSDVRQVQALINRHLPPRATLLKLDGIVGPKTLGRIAWFQSDVVKLRAPDTRVDPDGPTLRALRAAPHVARATTPSPRPTAPAARAPTPTARPPVTPPTAPRVAGPAPAPSGVARPPRDVIAWGAKVSPAFKRTVMEITARLDISADFLMSCMAFESGETFSPSIRNAAGSGAVGLIQFMPKTAKALHTSTAALAAMSAESQLAFVERYFRPYKGRIRTIEDIYMTILFPRAIGRDQGYTLFSGDTKAYRQNKGLDADGDLRVNKYEAAAAVRAKYKKGLRPGYIG